MIPTLIAIAAICVAPPVSDTPTYSRQMYCSSPSPNALRAPYGWRDALDAIRLVETGGLPNEGVGAKGDYRTRNGKRVAMALGPYQVWEPYFLDAQARDKTLTTHRSCLTSKAYSERVVRAYMNRYARAALRRLESGAGTLADIETVARIHNGGPRANRPERLKLTNGYWAKIKKAVR